MTSKRAYLLRALIEWIADNNQTAYATVNAEVPGVQVPQNYVQDGQIVLNISNTAVRNLQVDNQYLTFDGRFGGNPIHVTIPVGAVVALYARETGDGMVFDVETTRSAEATEPKQSRSVEKGEPARSHLRVVK